VIADALGGLVSRRPLLIPLAAAPGTVAMLTTPDSRHGPRALKAEEYPSWSQQIAARSVLAIGLYRPGRHAKRIKCPLLAVVHEQDQTTPAALTVRAARRSPRGEIVQLPGGHYGAYLDSHSEAVRIDLAFLEHHLFSNRAGAGPAIATQ
jgi:pimeloyl-ACP methyl ester carboxylesterase